MSFVAFHAPQAHLVDTPVDSSYSFEKQMPSWKKKYPGVEQLTIAVMGCVVNGPGESKHADIGISLPGISEPNRAPVYADGKLLRTLAGTNIKKDFSALLEEYVQKKFTKIS